MDATLKRIVALLAPEHPADLRRGALLVLAEIGAKDQEIGQALIEQLDDADPQVREQVIVTLGKLHIEKSLPRLLERIEKGGAESELAAQAVARMGARGTKALLDLMNKVAPGLRRRIAGALGAGRTASAETAAIDALLDSDPGVVEAATRSLIAQIPSLSPSHRQALSEQLLGLLNNKKSPPSLASETAAVRLLAALEDPRIEKILWERLEPSRPPEMRAAALQALGKYRHAPNKDQLKRLLACAGADDFRVAAPALMILQNVPVEKASADWLALLQAPDVAVRRFAVEKLGERDSAEVAQALVTQLEHKDQGLREQALAFLGKTKSGRAALLARLQAAEHVDQAWNLARVQARWAEELPPATRTQLFQQACTLLEDNDRRADPFLFLLRAAEGDAVAEKLFDQAVAQRKKKNFEKALAYLRHLIRDPACAVPVRLETVACNLRLSPHDLASDSRERDPALQQLGRLLPHYESETLEFLQKARWLTPEDLFYVGFHFAEQSGPLRRFGGQVLKLLLKNGGKSKIAKDARTKLRSSGLE